MIKKKKSEKAAPTIKRGPAKKPSTQSPRRSVAMSPKRRAANLLGFDSGSEMDFFHLAQRVGFKEIEKQRLFKLFDAKKTKSKIGDCKKLDLTVDFIIVDGGINYIVDTKGAKETVSRDSTVRYNVLKHQIASGEWEYEGFTADNTVISWVYYNQIVEMQKCVLTMSKGDFISTLLKAKI